MRTLAASRPAIIDDGQEALDEEYRSARYLHHRLLDIEDEFQRVIDAAQEECAPGIGRVGRLLARLRNRDKRREKSTRFVPGGHPELRSRLEAIHRDLRAKRNAEPRWKEAMRWADTPGPEAPARGKARRRGSESDEEFARRCSERRGLLTRREQRRHELYAAHVSEDAAERSRVYWGTWNAIVRSVDQARSAVLDQRKAGLPAEWHRPRWDDQVGICADAGGFRIIATNDPWWTIETRLAGGWVRFRAKIGNWHEIPKGAKLRTLRLTRRKDGHGWSYSVSIVVAGMPDHQHPGVGRVALDWGHREHGHPAERDGIRAWTWVGSDGARGEILIPAECRKLRDEIDAMKSRLDTTFAARGVPDRSRHSYRSRLMRSGVRTEEETLWLRWETRYERRMSSARQRIEDLRRETYLRAIRELRQRYATFVTEDEPGRRHQKLDTDEQTRRRKRQNRDMVARYLFLTLCERSGAALITVPARNTTRQFACCGVLAENTPELLMACPSCGRIVDKDYHAAEEILRRGEEALAKQAAE